MEHGSNAQNNKPQPSAPGGQIRVTPEQFIANQRWLQQQASLFTVQNVQGLDAYFAEKEAEGERAKRQRQQLHRLMRSGYLLAPPPAVNGAIPIQYNISNYNAHQSLSGPSVVNGTQISSMNTQDMYNTPIPRASTSQQLPTSTRERPASAIQPPAPPNFSGTSTYVNTQSTQLQQSNQFHQLPRSSTGVNLFSTAQPAQTPTPDVHRVPERTAFYPQPWSNTTTAIGSQPYGSNIGPAGTYANQVSSSYPTSIAPVSNSGLEQGVFGAGPTRNFYSTSSSLAGALGEGTHAQLQSTNTSAPMHTMQKVADTAKGKERAQPEESSSHVGTSLAPSFSGPGQNGPTQITASSQSKTAPVVRGSNYLSDEQSRKAEEERVRKAVAAFQTQWNTRTGGIPVNSAAINQRAETGSAYVPKTAPSTAIQQNVSLPEAPGSANSVPSSSHNLVAPADNAASSYVGADAGVSTTVGSNTISMGSYTTTSAQNPPSAPNEILSSQPTGSGPSDRGLTAHYSSTTVNPNAASNHYRFGEYIPNFVSGHERPIRLDTPPPDANRPPEPLTPASANKKTLAKDILRALAVTPEKRDSSTPESFYADTEEPPTKKQMVEALPTDGPLVVQDMFYTLPMSPAPADSNDAAKIEEIDGPTVDAARIEGVDESTVNGAAVADSTADNRVGIVARNAAVDLLENDSSNTAPKDLSTVRVNGADGVAARTPTITAAPHVPGVRDSLVPESTIDSRASSEVVMDNDNALRPPEDPELPLFLPSPYSAPDSAYTGDGLRSTQTPDPEPSREFQRKHRFRDVYVEVPRLTPEQRRLYLKPKTTSMEVPRLKDISSETEARTSWNVQPVEEGRLRLAQDAYIVAASRLRRYPCLWVDCLHDANSANSLKYHVLDHVEAFADKDKIFPCWWGQCNRRFNKREALRQHLQNHVRKNIFCSYKGCDAKFNHPLDLLSHVERDHLSGSTLRPSSSPFVPPPQALQPLQTMCAYHSVSIPVKPAQVTQERRAVLGPWVAKNCSGAVNLSASILSTRNQMQRRRTDEGPNLPGDRQDRYDFVEKWGSTYPRNCADLESFQATEEIQHGLPLVPDVARLRGPLQEQLLTSRLDRMELKDPQRYGFRAGYELERPEREVSEIKIEDLSTNDFVPLSKSPERPTDYVFQDTLNVGMPTLA